jgi:hypothetical protein
MIAELNEIKISEEKKLATLILDRLNTEDSIALCHDGAYEFLLSKTQNDPEVRHVTHNRHSGMHYVSVSVLHPNSELKKLEVWQTFFAYADTLELASLKCYSQWQGIVSDAPF